jgi:ABC-type multidrug transport system permease subunit
VLAAVGQPLAVKRTVIAGHRTTLDAFAVAVSVTVSLMFVTVLLASGMLALEREEHAFGRLVRGLVSRLGLLGEKVALAAACAFVVTLVMLCGIGIFVALDWGRFALWLAALAGGAIGFGALGVAIGALARDVRAASLLAFLLTLPIAFLALVPAGTVASWLYDVIRGVSALFPFRPALQAVDAALNGAQPGLGPTLAHLAILAVAYLALARVALARFNEHDSHTPGGPPTAIRPTAPDDAAAQLALRLTNREHTGPWDPARDESFYTEGRPAPGARSRPALVGGRERLCLRRPRHPARRPPHRTASRCRTSCAVRGRTPRWATGSTRTRSARATPRAQCGWCCASPSSTRACTASSRRSSPATRARSGWPRRRASAWRAARCAT